MKSLIFASLILSATNSYALFTQGKLKKCHENFFMTSFSEQNQKKCFTLMLENQSELTEDQTLLLKTILLEIDSEKRQYLIPVLQKYAEDNDIEVDTIENGIIDKEDYDSIIKDLKSSNPNQITNALKKLTSHYWHSPLSKQSIKLQIYKDKISRNTIFQFFVNFRPVKLENNGGIETEVINTKKLKEIAQYFSLEEISETILTEENSSNELKHLALKYIKDNNKNRYVEIIVSRVEQENFYIQFLQKEINEDEIYKKTLSLFFKDPIKYNEFISVLFKQQKVVDQQRIYDLTLNPNLDINLYSSIIRNAIKYNLKNFKEDIVKNINNNSLSKEKKQFLLLSLASHGELNKDLLDILQDNKIGLNLRKEIACQITNGQNSSVEPLLKSLYSSSEINDNIKIESIKCLASTISSPMMSILNKIKDDTTNIELKLEILITMSPLLQATIIASEVEKILTQLDTDQFEKVFNILITKTSITGNDVLSHIIINSKKREAKKYLTSLIKGSKENQILLLNLFKTQSKFKIDIIKLITKEDKTSLLNQLLNENILVSLENPVLRQLKRSVLKIGNLKTMKKLSSIQGNIFSDHDINNLINKIENSVKVKQEKLTLYNQAIAALDDESSSLELLEAIDQNIQIITDQWELLNYLEGYSINYTERIKDIIKIQTNLAHHTINDTSLKALYKTIEALDIIKKEISFVDVNQTFESSFFVFTQLDNTLTNIPKEEVSKKINDLTNLDFTANINGLYNFITLRSATALFSLAKYKDLNNISLATKISNKLRTDLVEIIRTISPFHEDLKSLDQTDIEDIISGKQLFDPNDSAVANNSSTNASDRIIRVSNDLSIKPGIYMCPTASNCTIIVDGHLDMDPFSLIIPNYKKNGVNFTAPDIKLMANSFGSIYVDLSAHSKAPKKRKIADSGRAATYKSVFDRNERYCRKWIIVCVSKGTRAIYKTVVDVPAAPGGKGSKGHTGNHGGNLTISYNFSSSKPKTIKGRIYFISNGATGGDGGDGGKANGGPSDGVKGTAGQGGNAGNLKSEILLYDKMASSYFYILAQGGNPGAQGKGVGKAGKAEFGSNGMVKSEL